MDDANGVPQDEAQPSSSGGGARAAKAPRAQAPIPVEPRTIGEALRLARESAGLTLGEVAERTKVRPGILADIEADDHDRLPALTYSLGFVKAYARTVGLDAGAAAERYRMESRKGDPVPTQVDLQPLEAKRLPSARLVAITIGLLALALAGFWAWGAGWLTGTPPAEPAEVAQADAPAGPDMDGAPAPGADGAAAPGAGGAVAPGANGAAAPAPDPAAAVTIAAREEVWLRISDGTETFFMGTMTPGQTLALPPGRAWQLRTGRAGALEVRIGATALPPLGGPAEQVRNLSLKPEDLLARQAPAGIGAPASGPTPGIAPAVAPTGASG